MRLAPSKRAGQIRIAAAYIEQLPRRSNWTLDADDLHGVTLTISTTGLKQYRSIAAMFLIDLHKDTRKMLRKKIVGVHIHIFPPDDGKKFRFQLEEEALNV